MELQPPAAVLTVTLMLFSSTAEMSGVRLAGGRCSGTPMVLYEGEWSRVDGHAFDYRNAMVVCRELDCGSAVSMTFRLESNNTGVMVSCEGDESIVSECTLDKVHNSSFRTKVFCSDSVRLVDGAGLCSGRVEVKSHQSWTTVCEGDFDRQDAEVVCRELGCGTPLTLQGALFGEGKHTCVMEEFQCTGSEKSLRTCSTSARQENTYIDGKALGLTCSEREEVRLVDGRSRCAGTVEVFHSGEWRRLTTYIWHVPEAMVLCRQLGCGHPVVISERNPDRSKARVHANCLGEEAVLSECNYEKSSIGKDARVICSGLLEKPTIHFSASMDLQGPEVFRGHGFTINCSVEPQYPGGSFHLQLPGNKRSHAQAAVNHSAYFHFSADYSHQGGYRCVYQNLLSIKDEKVIESENPSTGLYNFSAKSKSLFLTVTDSPIPATITRMLLILSLMLITCTSVFLFFKKFGYLFLRNASAQEGIGAAAVQYENIEMVSLQFRTESSRM